jgi:hypothetical protein
MQTARTGRTHGCTGPSLQVTKVLANSEPSTAPASAQTCIVFAIATLVERHTRYVMLAKVAGKDTRTVVAALIKQAKKLTPATAQAFAD